MRSCPTPFARSGRRGTVSLVFSIDRLGRVGQKVVFAQQSGLDAFDKAAVAGLSASNPFPPLPAEFKGDQITLQFNFAYNAPGSDRSPLTKRFIAAMCTYAVLAVLATFTLDGGMLRNAVWVLCASLAVKTYIAYRAGW